MDTNDSKKLAKRTLDELLAVMGFGDASVEAFVEDDEEVLLHIESPEAGRLIGREGQVLQALQYILNRMLKRKNEDILHCTVDIERYRERRKDKLMGDAYRAADKAEATGRPVKLPPMQAGDRRIVHQALRNHEGIRTESEEMEDSPLKRVVVIAD